MGDAYTGLYYHLVFSTKHRRPQITEQIEARLYEYLSGVLTELQGHLIRAGGMPDHIHLLVRLPKSPELPRIMRSIKSSSSLWVHAAFPQSKQFAWQAGYGAFTVDATTLDRVARYIDRQKEHHRKMTFQEEFVKLLKRYQVPYDERYLWD